MRLTRPALDKIISDTVDQRTRSDRTILSVYLTGSLLETEYLLGGTADVDLVCVHIEQPAQDREVVHLTDELHLDIAHHFHRDYRQTRSLRVHPWLGPTIARCRVLYDPQHFMDFTQASVRGQFDQSEFILQRSRKSLDHARQIWLGFPHTAKGESIQEVLDYLRAIEHAANAVASLNGAPLTERRFLLKYLGRSEAVGRPGLYAGILGLLGAANLDEGSLGAWLPDWGAAYSAIPADAAPVRFSPLRRLYYQQAFEAMLAGGQPQAALWPVLWTWTRIISLLGETAEAYAAWQGAVQGLGLWGAGFGAKLAGLDAYLDTVEETLERFARENGVT